MICHPQRVTFLISKPCSSQATGPFLAEADINQVGTFAICGDEPGEVRSVTLQRTPKNEFIMDASERGVHVSDEDLENEHGNQRAHAGITLIGLTNNHRREGRPNRRSRCNQDVVY